VTTPATAQGLLRAAVDALDEAGVTWCLLRGEHALGEVAGDVDVLVSAASRERAGHALEHLGFARQPAFGRGTHTFFLGYDARLDRWVELDIVSELSYGPFFALATGAERGCLARRRRAGAVYVLDPDDAFWTLLLHCLLDKRAVAADRRRPLQLLAAAARADGPLGQILNGVCEPNGPTPAELLAAARHGDWGTLVQHTRSLECAWRRRHPLSVVRRRIAGRCARLVEKPAVLVHRRGLSAAVLGLDGAGKSTLVGALERSFRFPVRPIYMGLWKRGGVLRIATRPATVWRKYLTGRCHQRLGRLVVFDRYVYDALLPPSPPLVRLKRLYFWLLAHLCPAPDVVVLLDAPGTVAWARKGEQNAAELEEQRRHFLALRGRIPGLLVVDALQPPAAVRAAVTEHIWQRYTARWAGS
jgi:thymidylate kinase